MHIARDDIVNFVGVAYMCDIVISVEELLPVVSVLLAFPGSSDGDCRDSSLAGWCLVGLTCTTLWLLCILQSSPLPCLYPPFLVVLSGLMAFSSDR